MKDNKKLRKAYEEICDIYVDLLHNTPIRFLISSFRRQIENYRNPPNDGLHFSMPEEKTLVARERERLKLIFSRPI